MNKAIIIDPENKTISPLHDFTDDLQYHYRTIGNGNTGELEPIPDSLFGLIFNLIAGQIQWLSAADLDDPKIEIISF